MSAQQSLGHTEYAKAKGSDRIQINNVLSAACIGILSILLSVADARLSIWVIAQLAVAVPCLVTSSLAYAKMIYRPESEFGVWDTLAWATHSLGYLLVLNAVALLAYVNNHGGAAVIFLVATVVLFVAYSLIDILLKRSRLWEKLWKLLAYLALLFVGAVLPIVAGWV
jgi:hypothetical protein